MKRISIFGAFFAICIAVFVKKISASNDVSKENFRKLALANNELAFNLHRKFASGSSGNVFFSPFSISTALGMLFYGTRGETSEELRRVLGYEKAELLNDLVHETFGKYFKNVLNDGNSSDGYVLNSANSILADKSFGLLEEYRNNVADLYRAVVRDVDFSKEAPKLVEEINNWVKKKTNGKIEKFLDQLSPATSLVLLNAVYFKGAWKTPFNPNKTKDVIFYNNGLLAEAKNTPMMNLKAKGLTAFFKDFRALELPYEGENVSMVVLLPNARDGIETLEESLTPKLLNDILGRMQILKLNIFLPKFKLEFERELSGDLQALGAKRIFNGGADFSGMTPARGVSVSEVLHKAVIEVNEKGSEAAGVTDVVMTRSGPFPFKADHPFLFAIVEKGSKSNMVLFMGRVNNL